LRAADGPPAISATYGEQASQLYFPCGRLEPSDVNAGGLFDLNRLSRELREETGIAIDELDVEPGWILVRDLALMPRCTTRRRRSPRSQVTRGDIAGEPRPELSNVPIVRGPTELDTPMPRFTRAYLQEVLAE